MPPSCVPWYVLGPGHRWPYVLNSGPRLFTTMNGTIVFRDQKEPHIRVRWEKVAYAAKVDYTPSEK